MCEGAAQMALGAGFSQMASERCLTASSGHTGPPGPCPWAGPFQARRAYTVEFGRSNHHDCTIWACLEYGICLAFGSPQHANARSRHSLFGLHGVPLDQRAPAERHPVAIDWMHPARACKHQNAYYAVIMWLSVRINRLETTICSLLSPELCPGPGPILMVHFWPDYQPLLLTLAMHSAFMTPTIAINHIIGPHTILSRPSMTDHPRSFVDGQAGTGRTKNLPYRPATRAQGSSCRHSRSPGSRCLCRIASMDQNQ